MLSLKSECLDKMVLFGQEWLIRATREYLEHNHRERNHQGFMGRLPMLDRRSVACTVRSNPASVSVEYSATTIERQRRCSIEFSDRRPTHPISTICSS
jgi:hypothetical protein